MEHHEENVEDASLPYETSGKPPKKDARVIYFRQGLSFFLFGLINNVLYVIILSAALDLVPRSTPKGIIAFCNIAPALVAKVGWPYLLKGRIHYAKRIIGCCCLSVLGMITVAAFDALQPRLLGIGLASFSSGLGELTFLQLSTTHHHASVAGHSVGYFASGTGAAGLVGASLWWELRHLGVPTGLGISSVLPFIIPLAYFFILPKADAFHAVTPSEESFYRVNAMSSEYIPLPTSADELVDSSIASVVLKDNGLSLSVQDKIRLVKPLLARYMLPLFCVYLFEYTINQGIAPTLIFPVPEEQEHPIMRLFIRSLRDYYPLWQLVYQTTVFLSRSSISLGIPPLSTNCLPVPAIIQSFILIALAIEAATGIIPDENEGIAFALVFLLIAIEGTCGGLAYVNAFYRVNQDCRPSEAESGETDDIQKERARQEREFQIGSIGLADTSGILFASLVAMSTEIALCRAQVARGKTLCAEF